MGASSDLEFVEIAQPYGLRSMIRIPLSAKDEKEKATLG